MGWNGFGLASTFFDRNMSKNKRFTVKYYGAEYQGRIDSRADRLVYFFGESDAARTVFVREMANFIKYRTGKSFRCYDIGANHGDFCLALAGIVDSIVAFEQSPERFSHLAHNIAFSGAENIEAFNVRLGDVEQSTVSNQGGTASKNVTEPPSDLMRSKPRSSPGNLGRADLFVENSSLEYPDFVRINAGADYRAVLQGFGSILEASQPVVFIEQSTSLGLPYTDETDLRSALYEDAKLYTFAGSPYRKEFKLDKFDTGASRIVCFPPKISRMIEHEVCKMGGLRMLSFGR